MNDTDRTGRAGNFVFGRMSEAERERAERDLVRDQSFRDAVFEVAERARRLRGGSDPEENRKWDAVSARLAALPQMRAQPADETHAFAGSLAGIQAPSSPYPSAIAWTRIAVWRGALLALSLFSAFAVGYVAGAASQSGGVRAAVGATGSQ